MRVEKLKPREMRPRQGEGISRLSSLPVNREKPRVSQVSRFSRPESPHSRVNLGIFLAERPNSGCGYGRLLGNTRN
jgi:hypothetical protein